MAPQQPSSLHPEHLTGGRSIREAREKRGWSVRQLAGRAACDFSHLSRIERDLCRRPNQQVLARIAEALELDYADLLTRFGYQLPTDRPSLTRYLADRYDLDDTTAAILADQFEAVVNNHLRRRSNPSP